MRVAKTKISNAKEIRRGLIRVNIKGSYDNGGYNYEANNDDTTVDVYYRSDRSIGVVKPRLAFSLAILNEYNDEEENAIIHILLLVVM